MHTYTTLSLVYWKFHSSNCPYHSLSITVFFLPLFINCDSNKSLFIIPGNSDVRPDPELGSNPIQLEHINEKSCTIHPTSTVDNVPFAFPSTLQTLYLERNILSCSVDCLAGSVSISTKEGGYNCVALWTTTAVVMYLMHRGVKSQLYWLIVQMAGKH